MIGIDLAPEITLTFFLCLLVGVTLGLFGGGGSVLTVPIFVYVTKTDVHQAIGMSLLIVGAASLFGAITYWKKSFINKRLVVLFH